MKKHYVRCVFFGCLFLSYFKDKSFFLTVNGNGGFIGLFLKDSFITSILEINQKFPSPISYSNKFDIPADKYPPCVKHALQMIENHESEIKQILSSLYLNETEQHVIVRKLCCRERQTN